jgi:Relaxase/Mobilisation nuclease domain
MIAKIMKPSPSFQAVYYNEHKISEQKAQLMVAANFNQSGEIRGVGEMTKRDYIAYFTALSQTNERVKNRQFHAVISAKGQSHTAEELTAIAEEYLYRMGYGTNPYLIYFHQDTDNNHVHLVSSRVNTEGVKVNDSFEKRESLRHIQNIMERTPKEELSGTTIATRLLDYDFTTEGQLKTLIESMGYQAEKDGNSDWHILKVKDGQSRKVTQIDEAKIKAKIQTSQDPSANEKRAKRIQQLKAILTKYKDTKEGIEYIKEKMGIELVFHKSPNHDKPFGYTIIDHAEKRVLKGSEVIKLKTLLGEVQSHVDRLEKLVKDENPINLESLQNYLNDHDLHLVIKNGEPHLIDELNGEVYALKDISNLKGVLQSEEAKGIYTTNLDRAISLKPSKVIQEKQEKQEKREQGESQRHPQSLNLLPSGESEDEDRGKRKKTGYGY